jgi:hypothetical protein
MEQPKKYTRTNGVSITIIGGYECHEIRDPDGKFICSVMAPGLIDYHAPKPVTLQADNLLEQLNAMRQACWLMCEAGMVEPDRFIAPTAFGPAIRAAAKAIGRMK